MLLQMSRQPCVYILTSGRNGTLYIGVTSNLAKRLHEHRNGTADDFAARYDCDRLVRFELFEEMPTAIAREKQLKRWRREWKLNLIEQDNPEWRDLAVALGLTEAMPPPPSVVMLNLFQHPPGHGHQRLWDSGC